MDSKDLRRRHGELSQKIKSFKMAATRDFSGRLQARRRSTQISDVPGVDIQSLEQQTSASHGGGDCAEPKSRRPASSCVSRHEWTSASRLDIQGPDFLRILHEQIWRSICYVKRQTLCFIEGEDNAENGSLMALVYDLERQMYQIEDVVLEKQAIASSAFLDCSDKTEEREGHNDTSDLGSLASSPGVSDHQSTARTPLDSSESQLIEDTNIERSERKVSEKSWKSSTNCRGISTNSLCPTIGLEERPSLTSKHRQNNKENDLLPAVYAPRMIRKKNVNKWKSPMSAQDICIRDTDTASKRQRIGPLYFTDYQDEDGIKPKNKRRRDLAPLKVRKVMKDSTSWIYFNKNK